MTNVMGVSGLSIEFSSKGIIWRAPSFGFAVDQTVVAERKKEKTLQLRRNTYWRASLSSSM
jgi:hypothetical protein